jgi:glycosyltransferase involved in cell wall biosynthesis
MIPMRLLLVNYEFPPLGGGAGGAARNLAGELVKLGHEVVVLTSHFRGLEKMEREDGYVVRRVFCFRGKVHRSNPGQMLAFALAASLKAVRLEREFQPDASICFFGIPGGVVGYFLRALRGTPYVVSLRGGDVPGHQPEQLAGYHRLVKPFIRSIWKRARYVVANGSGLRDLARKFMPGLEVPLVPNGVDTRTFFPSNGEPEKNRGPAGLLFVGRVSSEKGLQGLLRMLAELTDREWIVDLYGDGPELPGLIDLSEQLGLADRLRFHGWAARELLPEAYRKSDIFVFPSDAEGMPNAVLEAMASGLPVLAYDVPGVNDLVTDGETGFVVRPGDGAAFVTCLRRLLDDPFLAARMGEEGRIRAENSFSWRKCARAYSDLCAGVGLRVDERIYAGLRDDG